MVCGCASIWMMEGTATDRPPTQSHHQPQYTIHSTHYPHPPTCEGDGARELRCDAQGGVADGLAEQGEEDGPREGEELGCLV